MINADAVHGGVVKSREISMVGVGAGESTWG